MELIPQITGLVLSIETKFKDYFLDKNDVTIVLDGSRNAVTVTLPATTAAGRVPGRTYYIKAVNRTYITDIDPNGNSIDGQTSNFVLSTDEVITVQFDDVVSIWRII